MAKFKDLTGQKFGQLTVLSLDSPRKGRVFWKCKCDCGNYHTVRSNVLLRGKSTSCGCARIEAGRKCVIDLTGKKFGSLIVVRRADNIGKHVAWECLCDCGNTKITKAILLTQKHAVSCGCRIDKMPQNDPKLVTAKAIWRKNYSDGNILFEKFIELSQQKCHYCDALPSNSQDRLNVPCRVARRKKDSKLDMGRGLFVYNGLDRIDSSKLHDLDNVVPCCKLCNNAKLNMAPEKFQSWLKQTAAYHLYKMTSDQLDEAVAEWKAKNEKAPSSSLGAFSELALVS